MIWSCDDPSREAARPGRCDESAVFKFRGREHPERRVSSDAVVEDLDVLEGAPGDYGRLGRRPSTASLRRSSKWVTSATQSTFGALGRNWRSTRSSATLTPGTL